MIVILTYIIFGFLAFLILIQLYYHLRFFSALSFRKIPSDGTKQKVPVSVIIAARNESENLKKNLEYFLNQDYNDYEVIVVNDCSYDRSQEVLVEFQKHYQHLKVVELIEDDRYRHGKKFALTLGIKAAKNEHLLFSDADCRPSTNKWIEIIQGYYAKSNDVQIVLGFSPFIKIGGFLNYFSRFETFFTAYQYISFSLKNKSYMGVGRNLSYTKSLFFQNKGFAAHMHLLSGDDDLFVNQASNSVNTIVCIEPESFVYSEAKTSWKDYFKQKMRHLSVGKLYKSSDKWNLSLIASSATLFYIAIIVAYSLQIEPIIISAFLTFRMLLIAIFYYSAMKKLHMKDLWWFFPILDILYFLTMPLWSLISIFIKQKRWK